MRMLAWNQIGCDGVVSAMGDGATHQDATSSG